MGRLSRRGNGERSINYSEFLQMEYVMSAIKQSLWVGAISICLALISGNAEAVTADDMGTAVKGKSNAYPCYDLTDVSLQSDGYLASLRILSHLRSLRSLR